MTNLKNLDIVYLVKNSKYNGELRHSLRSVCQNFPHRNIWFVGGMPERIKPDYYIPVRQPESNTKYENFLLLIDAIINSKGISSSFVLFNDDFFVLNKVKQLPVYINGTIPELIEFVKRESVKPNSNYIKILNHHIIELKNRKLPINNFALHVPMVLNKTLIKNVIEEFGTFGRSLYGNYVYYTDYCEQMKDVKIMNHIQIPTENQIYVSTSDGSFNLGEVGKYIRNKFNEPCKYEYE